MQTFTQVAELCSNSSSRFFPDFQRPKSSRIL